MARAWVFIAVVALAAVAADQSESPSTHGAHAHGGGDEATGEPLSLLQDAPAHKASVTTERGSVTPRHRHKRGNVEIINGSNLVEVLMRRQKEKRAARNAAAGLPLDDGTEDADQFSGRIDDDASGGGARGRLKRKRRSYREKHAVPDDVREELMPWLRGASVQLVSFLQAREESRKNVGIELPPERFPISNHEYYELRWNEDTTLQQYFYIEFNPEEIMFFTEEVYPPLNAAVCEATTPRLVSDITSGVTDQLSPILCDAVNAETEAIGKRVGEACANTLHASLASSITQGVQWKTFNGVTSTLTHTLTTTLTGALVRNLVKLTTHKYVNNKFKLYQQCTYAVYKCQYIDTGNPDCEVPQECEFAVKAIDALQNMGPPGEVATISSPIGQPMHRDW